LAVIAAAAMVVGGTVAMTATSAAAAPSTATKTFTYTGGEQQFVVPIGVTSADVVAVGGSGAAAQNTSAGTSKGGQGARVATTLALAPGNTLYVEVGGDGTSSAGGFNGGGYSTEPFPLAPGGGGGATDIRTSPCGSGCPGAAGSLQTRLIVAGGGGGGGATGNINASLNPLPGGNGGAAAHAGGGSGINGGPSGGGQGTTTAAGAGGGAGTIGGQPGHDGSLGKGGDGGAEAGGGGAGGGGGGGYYGGGGGGGGGADTSGNIDAEVGGGGGGGGASLTAGGTISFPAGTPASVTFTYQAPPPDCTVTPHVPSRLSITAAETDYSATITGCTGDLAAATTELARVGGTASEQYALIFAADGQTGARTAHFTVAETDSTGSYQTQNGIGGTTEGGALIWNSASSSLRDGSWTSISTSRTGTKVTITSAVSSYVPGQGRVHYAGRLMTFQARHSLQAAWTTVGHVRTGATGRASLTRTSGLVNYYRVVLTDIDTVWGSTSGTSHR